MFNLEEELFWDLLNVIEEDDADLAFMLAIEHKLDEVV